MASILNNTEHHWFMRYRHRENTIDMFIKLINMIIEWFVHGIYFHANAYYNLSGMLKQSGIKFEKKYYGVSLEKRIRTSIVTT